MQPYPEKKGKDKYQWSDALYEYYFPLVMKELDRRTGTKESTTFSALLIAVGAPKLGQARWQQRLRGKVVSRLEELYLKRPQVGRNALPKEARLKLVESVVKNYLILKKYRKEPIVMRQLINDLKKEYPGFPSGLYYLDWLKPVRELINSAIDEQRQQGLKTGWTWRSKTKKRIQKCSTLEKEFSYQGYSYRVFISGNPDKHYCQLIPKKRAIYEVRRYSKHAGEYILHSWLSREGFMKLMEKVKISA